MSHMAARPISHEPHRSAGSPTRPSASVVTVAVRPPSLVVVAIVASARTFFQSATRRRHDRNVEARLGARVVDGNDAFPQVTGLDQMS